MSEQIEEQKNNDNENKEEQPPQEQGDQNNQEGEEQNQEQSKEGQEEKKEETNNENNKTEEENKKEEGQNAEDENGKNGDENGKNGEENENENNIEVEEEQNNGQGNKNNYRKDENLIELQIKQETIQIEQKKIDLRIMKERLAQKEKIYNELQGKPTNKTAEEKERERKEHKKAIKGHKFTDAIVRKKGREKQLQDEREKLDKEYNRKRTEFQKLTTDINELIISNKELKEEIVNLRKRKNDALKKKEEIVEENEQKRQNLKESEKRNEVAKSQIMHKEYKNTVTEGEMQQKEFGAERDKLEEEYQKIREEYIRRERENKNENAKKRNMAALSLSNKGMPSNSRNKDIELEIKRLQDEEIMDRIPMLDLCIEKWRVINSIKKSSIQIFQQNSTKIREAFNKLTKYIGIDSFTELPLVFKKTEQQMSNINIYKEKLEVQNDKLEYEKEMIIKQIDLLSKKKKKGNLEKSQFIEQKINSINIIDDCAGNFEKEINKRKKLFDRIRPSTNAYLVKLGNTYLADFIYDKINIDNASEYNEKTIDKYLSNVQDYFKLVQEWDRAVKSVKENENEIDKLREEMKQKLGKFEQNRLLTNEVYQSMEAEYKKGTKLDEIIKKNSQKIALDIQYPMAKSTAYTKNTQKKKNFNISTATTEPGNYRYGNESNITNNQQSSIIYPNSKSKASKKKYLSTQAA